MRIRNVMLLLAGGASSSLAHEGHGHHGHEGLKPHSHAAFHHVEAACTADVEKLCSPKVDERDMLLQFYSQDPILTWILAPPGHGIAMPPEIHNLNLFMDRMMDSVFSMPPPQHQLSITWATSVEPEEQEHPSSSGPHVLVDSAVAKLASHKEPEEIPRLAVELQQYGDNMLRAMDPAAHDMHHRMARRLTEMDATTIQHHVRLPFGCPKNRCLQEAITSHQVSQPCVEAVRSLERTYVLEEEVERQQALFVGMLWVYVGALMVLMVMVARRYRANGGRRRMAQRVLLAVYSSPALKKKVEKDLGESLGDNPPLPHHSMRFMAGSGRAMKRRMRCLQRVHGLFLVLLTTLVFVAPFWVLPVCILITLVRVAQLCLAGAGLPKSQDDCTCCCCAATPSLAKAGLLTDEQACCSCCKGTGVCSAACAKCCGGEGCCCSGSSDCCCCASSKVTADCACCCCAATPSLAEAGMLTEEQACCNCCKGTGVCSAACAKCCGGGGCCCCGSSDCCCCASSKVTADCTCCCCAATPSLAKAGMLTDEQACCNCCKGTGVCSAACAKCCGGGGSCCGCCCSCCAAGDCCMKKGRGQKHVVPASHAVYEGIPIQIV